MTVTSRSDGASLPESADTDDAGQSVPLRALHALLGGCCVDCGARYSAREAVFTTFLGLQNSPRCLPCTSTRLERPVHELRADLLAYIQHRDCYLQAWREAERIDGVNRSEATLQTLPSTSQMGPAVDGSEAPVAFAWNAGDMACGELVMELRMRMAKLAGGEILRVTARDPAAPEDLPAWCRLCGHTLVAMNHPHYWIRRKGD
jgi:tRNA 2-thiouridine synthesizing protein A